MRAIVQRVRRASVTVDDETVGAIDAGLVVLVGCGQGDDERDVDQMVDDIVHLRIFADDDGRMNRSLVDVGASLLAVPQFTLYADTDSGRRPSFFEAMKPGPAKSLYGDFVDALEARDIDVATGVFGATMQIEMVNDGPVTIVLDTDE